MPTTAKMGTKSRGPELVAVSILMLALSMIFSLLRLYARAFIVKQIGSDDYLAFASFVSNTAPQPSTLDQKIEDQHIARAEKL